MENISVTPDKDAEDKNKPAATFVETNDISDTSMTELTEEDLKRLLMQTFQQFINDEKANPFLSLRKKVEESSKNMEKYQQEANNLLKSIEVMVENHEKFLRKKNLLPKVQTRTIGVNVKITPIKEYDDTLRATANSVPTAIQPKPLTNDGNLPITHDRLQAGIRFQLPQSIGGYRSLLNANALQQTHSLSLTSKDISTVNAGPSTTTVPQRPRTADSLGIFHNRQLIQPNILQRSRVVYPMESNSQWQQ